MIGESRCGVLLFFRALLGLLCAASILFHWAAAEQPPVAKQAPNHQEKRPAELSAEDDREPISERDALVDKAQKFKADGKIAEAIEAAERVLAVDVPSRGGRTVLKLVADDLDFLAGLHEQRGTFAAARKLRLSRQTICEMMYGLDDWRTTDASLAVANVDCLAKLSRDERNELARADQWDAQADTLCRAGRYQQAVTLADRCATIRKRLLGENHPAYASSLNSLAALYRVQGDYARAEPLYRQALEIRKKTFGENHPHYAQSLNNLATLYCDLGDYARAEPLYRQAAETYKKALGETHSHYAGSLGNLATLYCDLADYARAEPLYRQALEIDKKALGENHPDYATDLIALAGLYCDQGYYSRYSGPKKLDHDFRSKSW
jgi:tetratricopeptide (TPR) repeat protein